MAIAELLSESSSVDAKSLRVCMYVCMYVYIIYQQARPLALLALSCVAKWTIQAIHHHLGDCS